MAKGIQSFRETEVRRAVRALRDAGVEIRRVTFEGGKFEFITGEDTPSKATKTAPAKPPTETAADAAQS
jgi:hypothetical protein